MTPFRANLKEVWSRLTWPDLVSAAVATAGLLASTVLGAAQGQRLEAIPGAPPDMTLLPPGCSFAPRCRFAEARCSLDLPPEIALAPDHMVRCLRVAAGEITVAAPTLAKQAV